MDPVTAIAQALKAVCEMVTELSRGQSVEQKQKLWEMYIEDVTFLRGLLKPKQ